MQSDTTRETVVPSIPEVTPDNMVDALRAIKELLEVREGVSGDPLDQVVTYRELFQRGGLQRSVIDGTVIVRLPGMDGVTYLPAPLPADAPDYTPPPAPTGLAASGAMANAILTWDSAQYHNHAYTEVWRASTNDLGQAVRVGTTDAALYADNIGQTGVTRYYWIRFVSQTNVIGPYNAINGTSATTGIVLTGDIADASITTQKLADGAVQTAKLGDAQVTTTKVGDSQVTTSKIADASVTTTKIGDNQVTTIKIGDAQVTTTKIGDSQVTTAKIGDLSVTTGKIAAGAVDTTKFASGITPVEIVSTLPATGNFTGRTVMLTIDGKLYRYTTTWTAAVPTADLTGQITETQITDSAVSTPKLAAGAVTAAKISAGTITSAEIAADTITAGNIAAGAIGASEIAAAAVVAGKIAAGTITSAEIAADTITAGNIAAGAIGASEIAAAAVVAGKIATGAIVAGDGVISNLAIGTALIADAAITNVKIGALAVDSAKIADAAVVTAKIGDLNVTTAKLADANVTTAKIADLNVTTAKIAALAVTAAEIANATITTGKIANAQITTALIADLNVTTAKIADLNVTTAKIADLNVSTAKIADLNITTGKVGNNAITTAAFASSNGFDRFFTAGSFGAGSGTDDFASITLTPQSGDVVLIEASFKFATAAYSNALDNVTLTPKIQLSGDSAASVALKSALWRKWDDTGYINYQVAMSYTSGGTACTAKLQISYSNPAWTNDAYAEYSITECVLRAFTSRK